MVRAALCVFALQGNTCCNCRLYAWLPAIAARVPHCVMCTRTHTYTNTGARTHAYTHDCTHTVSVSMHMLMHAATCRYGHQALWERCFRFEQANVGAHWIKLKQTHSYSLYPQTHICRHAQMNKWFFYINMLVGVCVCLYFSGYNTYTHTHTFTLSGCPWRLPFVKNTLNHKVAKPPTCTNTHSLTFAHWSLLAASLFSTEEV